MQAEWPELRLAWEGLVLTFILTCWISKDEISDIVMALSGSSVKLQHDPFLATVVRLEGRRRRWKILASLPQSGEPCFVIRAVHLISLHSSFPMIGIWVWAEWNDGVITAQLETQSQNWSLWIACNNHDLGKAVTGTLYFYLKTCSIFIPGKVTTSNNILSTNSSRNVGFHIYNFLFCSFLQQNNCTNCCCIMQY